ncbi:MULTISPECIES: TetR/AcrR family transcriptional regulator [unclassified Variovorax]|uniref:TetR/AcrR family transcriptional regulator n=1 Tax=unclassified Variovorax TaxID=663243 RepID=UPI002574A8C2|nr:MULTISPECIES: TetR/AcrR family transcriptional regulator [unclassified Variovorax]MDM0089195.1 TetR/AcrR family transcriptional regulator [Variovorax sp. J22G40]MDM0147268.1 TetR/AcrR family transcriptional regulator [Variovorax sp. J2P1-31]
MTTRRPSLKPRKIPTQSRAEQTVAALLEAAARVLEAKGLEGLNTNKVAELAGVSVGSLYQYFPGKDALVVALLQRERAAFLAAAQGALAEPTGRQGLERLVAASVHQQLYRPALVRLLDFEERRPAIARELAPFITSIGALIAALLHRADVPPQPDIETATDDVIAIVRALVNAAGEREDLDRRALEGRICQAVFGYLGLPRPAVPRKRTAV